MSGQNSDQPESGSDFNALKAENAELKQQLAARVEDIVLLMQHTEADRQNSRKSDQALIQKLRKQRDDAMSDLISERAVFLDKFTEQRDAYEATLAEFSSSLSWRITKPLRGLKGLIARLRG
ncbi:hypothetical protein [Paracoccus sp. SCSIO 75233]|uniref:hypothetical protein n=1 Tax=Paracoccus sp. SCSIO 75233 TaxID=3017782 RepID=UPI0022F0C8D7|nr:hypothetical protein [Paracoccus sp. SCSIO 75233]WBU54340.1 hypothetical protein PAF12_05765 [Paracoccus sp. SCSIO 75233]